MNENCYNSRITNDIDMKIGPVTKIDKRNTTISKKLMITPCREIVTSLLFLEFMVNFKQFASRISDAWSIIFTFLLNVTFHLTITKNRTKKT